MLCPPGGMAVLHGKREPRFRFGSGPEALSLAGKSNS